MNSIFNPLFRFFESEYVPRRRDLDFYRFLFCTFALLQWPFYSWLEHLRDFMYAPPISPIMFFTAYPHPALYTLLNALAGISLVLLLFGKHLRIAALTFSLSYVLLSSWAFSTGKINHPILIAVIPIAIAFALHAARRTTREPALDRQTTADTSASIGFPLAMLAFLTAYWIFTAGWQKMTSQWLSFEHPAVHRHIFTNVHITGRETWAADLLLTHATVPVWKFLDVTTVFFELSPIFLVWRRSWFRAWTFAACFFHLGIDVVMGIPYAPALLAYAAFVPWTASRTVDKAMQVYESRPLRTVLVMLLGIIALKLLMEFGLLSFSLQRLVVRAAPFVALLYVWIAWRNDRSLESARNSAAIVDSEPVPQLT
jgi:hypothetical protein